MRTLKRPFRISHWLLAGAVVVQSPFSMTGGADLSLQQAGFLADRFNRSLYRPGGSFEPWKSESETSAAPCHSESESSSTANWKSVCNDGVLSNQKKAVEAQGKWLTKEALISKQEFPKLKNWEKHLDGICDSRTDALHASDLSIEKAQDEVRGLVESFKTEPDRVLQQLRSIQVKRVEFVKRFNKAGQEIPGNYVTVESPRLWETWKREDLCGLMMVSVDGADPQSHLLHLYLQSDLGRLKLMELCEQPEALSASEILKRVRPLSEEALLTGALSLDSVADQLKSWVPLSDRQALATQLRPECDVRSSSKCYCLGDEARARTAVDRFTADRVKPASEDFFRKVEKKFLKLVESMGLSDSVKDAIKKDLKKLPIDFQMFDSPVFNAFYVPNERQVLAPTSLAAALALGQPTDDYELTMIHELGHHFAHVITPLNQKFCEPSAQSGQVPAGCRTSGARGSLQPGDVHLLEEYRSCLDRNILEGEWKSILAPDLRKTPQVGGLTLTEALVESKRAETFADFFMAQYLKEGRLEDPRKGLSMLCPAGDLHEEEEAKKSASLHSHDSHADPRYRIPMILEGGNRSAVEKETPTLRCEQVLWP